MKFNFFFILICASIVLTSCMDDLPEQELLSPNDIETQLVSPRSTTICGDPCPNGCEAYPSLSVSGPSLIENDGSTTVSYTASGIAPAGDVTWKVGTYNSGGNFIASTEASPSSGTGKTATFTIPNSSFEGDLVVEFLSLKNCGNGCHARRWDYKTFNVQPIPTLPAIFAVEVNGPQDCFEAGDFIDFHDSPGPSTIANADRLVWTSTPSLSGFDTNTNNTRLLNTFYVPNSLSTGCYTVFVTAYNDHPGGSIASNTVSVTFRVNAPGTIGCQSCDSGPGGPAFN